MWYTTSKRDARSGKSTAVMSIRHLNCVFTWSRRNLGARGGVWGGGELGERQGTVLLGRGHCVTLGKGEDTDMRVAPSCSQCHQHVLSLGAAWTCLCYAPTAATSSLCTSLSGHFLSGSASAL
jgi:hypothetical protein